jgi:hypothetical protein
MHLAALVSDVSQIAGARYPHLSVVQPLNPLR